MALVVLLRGVNVGGHRTFRPTELAKQLADLDVVNIGAAGTFVVRQRVTQARLRAELTSRLPFDAAIMMVRSLKKSMRFACFHLEPRQRDLSYTRADFCVDVDYLLFDAFFNASSGYRGAYFEAPEQGLAANQRLLSELSPFLIESAVDCHPDVDRAWLAESMSLPTAKAWLAEDPLALCAECAGGWSQSYVSDVHITNGRWEHSSHTHATWGQQAPLLSKVRIFGGFISDAHQEWIADHKRERAQHIWEHGWT